MLRKLESLAIIITKGIFSALRKYHLRRMNSLMRRFNNHMKKYNQLHHEQFAVKLAKKES